MPGVRAQLDDLAARAVGKALPARRHEAVMGRLRPLIWRGDRVECPCCGGHFEKFLPYWNRDHCLCPRCGSHERHRALWLYLQRRTDLLSAPHELLHLAPEPSIARHLKDRPNLRYVSADLSSPVAMMHFDITEIPFEEGAFDVVLCGHVLTEVPDDRKAMREMLRVLRPGGWAVVMAAVEPDRETTYEDSSITDPEQRRVAFLEPGNVRVYGRDFANRLREAGFETEVIPFVRELGDDEVRRYSLLPADEIYFCRR